MEIQYLLILRKCYRKLHFVICYHSFQTLFKLAKNKGEFTNYYSDFTIPKHQDLFDKTCLLIPIRPEDICNKIPVFYIALDVLYSTFYVYIFLLIFPSRNEENTADNEGIQGKIIRKMLNASCTDPVLLYSLYYCQIYAKFIYAKYDKAVEGKRQIH